jgi:lysophospholipid acyltransferase (LPLAT)-like uncharacterized protein
MTAEAKTPAVSRVRWEALVGVWIVKLLSATWRVRRVRPENFDGPLREKRPVVFTLWHGQLLPLLARHRRTGIVVLISEHGDGEIVAQMAQRLGFETLRGSTSRGAARALVGLTRLLGEGRPVAITPDGPRGPARSFAPGALVAAQRAGVEIVPLIAIASSAWRLKSWDSFMIPKPFARVTFAYGDPQRVHADTPRGAAEEADRFRRIMDDVEHDAAT